MSRGKEALVEPELLAWARKTAKLDLKQAAKRLGVTDERIAQWERGELRPTMSQLRAMADVYHRPLAVFYLPEPPRTFLALSDFRRLPDVGDRDISSTLALEIRRAQERREVALDLLREMSETPTEINIDISLRDDPEMVSARIREFLGVPIDTQHQWRTADEALASWKAAFEAVGVLAFQTSRVPVDEMRGASIGLRPLPAILLNGSDAATARSFSLFHEFVHILLNDSGLCDMEENARRSATEQRIEAYCNRVAGAALVPTLALLGQPIAQRGCKSGRWEDSDIARLAALFSVSREVLLRRLLTLGLVDQEFYSNKRREYQDEYLAYRKEQSGGPPYHTRMLARNGLRYTKLVLDAYHRDRITASELCDYLGMGFGYLPDTERAVYQARGAAI